MVKLMTAEEAINTYIKDGLTIAFGGFDGVAYREKITATIEEKFLASGSPKALKALNLTFLEESKAWDCDRCIKPLKIEGFAKIIEVFRQ